jgi:uncharacterized membrane protein
LESAATRHHRSIILAIPGAVLVVVVAPSEDKISLVSVRP